MDYLEKQLALSSGQIREVWEGCGLFHGQTKDACTLEYHNAWFAPLQTSSTLPVVEISTDPPLIDIKNLFKYAVPIVVKKLESRFDDRTNLVRGLRLLFAKWVDKVEEGYSLKDALFLVIQEVIRNGKE